MSINKSSVNRNDSDRFEAHAPVGNVAKPKNWQKTADAPRGKKVKVRAVKARTASAKSVEKAPEKKPEPVKSVEKVPEKKAEPVKSVEKSPRGEIRNNKNRGGNRCKAFGAKARDS